MFLSVSQPHSRQSCCRPILLVTLLMASSVTYAESATVAEGSEKSTDSVTPVVRLQQNQTPPERAQRVKFPRWPQYRQADKAIIPPPPPGPYMSSALRDYSVRMPAPGHHHAIKSAPWPVKNLSAPAHRNVPAARPMGMYSPDIPWPKHLRPEPRVSDHRATRKVPHHVKPTGAMPSPYATVPDKNPGYYYRNGQRPYRNGTSMNSSGWMPAMGMSPAGPYGNRLNYAPDNGSNHGLRYGRPMMNNGGNTSANHAYR